MRNHAFRAFRALLCAALLCLGLCPRAAADSAPAGDGFRFLKDGVFCTLPNAGKLYHEPDYEDGWTGSEVIWSETAEGEFCMRTADLTGMLEYFAGAYPGGSMENYQASAMLNYANIIIQSFGGSYSDLDFGVEDGAVWTTFGITYPDSPGASFEGRGLMLGSRAVVVYGASGEELSAAMASIRVATEEEQAQWLGRTGERYSLGALTADFPLPVTRTEAGDTAEAFCLTDSLCCLALRKMDRQWTVPEDDEEAERFLLQAAQTCVLPELPGAQVKESVLTRPAEGVAVLTFTAAEYDIGNYVTTYRFQLWVTPDRVYIVRADTTEEGEAFLNSIEYTGG